MLSKAARRAIELSDAVAQVADAIAAQLEILAAIEERRCTVMGELSGVALRADDDAAVCAAVERADAALTNLRGHGAALINLIADGKAPEIS